MWRQEMAAGLRTVYYDRVRSERPQTNIVSNLIFSQLTMLATENGRL